MKADTPSRDTARRRRNVAIALTTLGAPLAAVSPAVADNGADNPTPAPAPPGADTRVDAAPQSGADMDVVVESGGEAASSD
jgi:hypothetical protein